MCDQLSMTVNCDDYDDDASSGSLRNQKPKIEADEAA